MYFDTSLKTSRVDLSALSSPRLLSRNGPPQKDFLRKREMDGSDGTRKDTEDAQIEEVKCAIRALLFVTKLSPVGCRNSHGDGYRVTLRCPSCEEYGSCGKKQEPPVQVSSVHPTELACLQESTAAGASNVHLCSDVGMAVCHVVGSCMCLVVCVRSSLSGRKTSSLC
jgi:hypothetical protein